MGRMSNNVGCSLLIVFFKNIEIKIQDFEYVCFSEINDP